MNGSSTLESLDYHFNTQDRPFGYLFTGADDEPAPAPEAPALGEPLLNDFELDSSNQFFDRFNNDSNFLDDTNLLDTMGQFDSDPPPSFHGVASSLGRAIEHSTGGQGFEFAGFGQDLSSRFGQANLQSPTANRDGSQTQDFSRFNGNFTNGFPQGNKVQSRHQSGIFNPEDLFAVRRDAAAQNRIQNHRQSMPAALHGQFRFDDNFFLDAQKHGEDIENADSHKARMRSLGFGSDTSFRKNSYQPPGSNLSDLKSAEAQIQANLRLLEGSNQMLPSSPNTVRFKRRLSDHDGEDFNSAELLSMRDSKGNIRIFDKKQRKLSHPDDDHEDSMHNSGRPKKSRSINRHRNSTEIIPVVRRKSTTNGDRAPRQNLTEEEKKQNHIRSEQKRRNQIKKGFDDLVRMMPNGSSAGPSKCAILSQAVDWMSGLIEGNRQLQVQLEQMSR